MYGYTKHEYICIKEILITQFGDSLYKYGDSIKLSKVFEVYYIDYFLSNYITEEVLTNHFVSKEEFRTIQLNNILD